VQRSDIRAVGDLASAGSSMVAHLVRCMQARIASRALGSIRAPAMPTRIIRDGLMHAIYGHVDGGIRSATHAVSAVVSEICSADTSPNATVLASAAGTTTPTASLFARPNIISIISTVHTAGNGPVCAGATPRVGISCIRRSC
jgi:hypothetical protein